jgi:hypothetical protein
MNTLVRSHRVLVHAPLQTTFDYVSDLTRHPEWSGGELKVEALMPGPVAIGKEYVSRGEVAIQKNRPNTVRVSACESPHKFGFVAKDPDFGEVSHLFTFAEEDGGVLITRTMTLSLSPVKAFLFRFFIYPLIGRRSMNRSMARLKTKLEKAVLKG